MNVRDKFEQGDFTAIETYIRTNIFDKPAEFYLVTNSILSHADFKALQEWRDRVPEYVKDYVSLNKYM